MHKVLRTPLQNYSRRKVIQSATVTDFGGGLNFAEDDLNISSKFAKALDNFYRAQDGRLRLRYGTHLFCDLAAATGNVLNVEYFNGFLIAATVGGEVWKVTAPGGVATKIWPTGAPGKVWSAGLTTVNMCQFRGELYIVNGVDKPLKITNAMVIDFLGDPGNANSNVNTPICKYIVTAKEYVVMVGLSTSPSKVYISARQSGGTWPLDVAPNDATTIDVGASITRGDAKCTGIAALNNYVLVFFEESTVILQLGTYGGSSGTTHLVGVFDTLSAYGAIAHRTAANVSTDVLFCDLVGVASATRNQFGTAFTPERPSELVDPALQVDLATARANGIDGNIFAIYHKLLGQYMLFVKPTSGGTQTCWVYTFNKKREEGSWSQFKGWDFQAGCVDPRGRVYFVSSKKLLIYGDKASGNEYFDDLGAAISFTWELPWSAYQHYDNIKKMKAIRIYSRGTAEFTCQLFVDGIYQKDDGSYDPTASIDFVAGGIQGFGGTLGTEPYGGGRIADDPRIWRIDGKFIQGKLRFTGSTTNDLQFIGISIAYTLGGRKR